MNEPDKELKAQIASILEEFGFEVTDLEEREEDKTPDLLATAAGKRFLIEVKAKMDDQEELERQEKRAFEGEVGQWSEPWAPRNTISSVVQYGAQQLAAFPQGSYDFALLWLHAAGMDPRSQLEQFAHTLYGLTRVYSLKDPAFDYECYFFHESAFFSLKDTLDGAVTSTPEEMQLCLNPYSLRADAFRDSLLVAAFEGGVRDPEKLEAEGEAIIADFEANRRNSVEVIAGLQEKYQVALLDHMHVGRTSAWVYVDQE